ncbi:mitochondrial-processing peptidase subunit alpha-like isoform X3 [Magnolia sinica]|uniref:mitochondrial-processing peptidase subunit alpha-like isoform X3 n=1 Tax=Magnolia sinica TaxID=86752 RepID=UPI00265B17AE|nr:mitochondrial-processing peptidase subunit alpha-like isoform X3 [Magnolia sinica]
MFGASLSRILLRKLFDDGIHHIRCTSTRFLCNQNQQVFPRYSSKVPRSWFNGSYANRFPPLNDPLPDLKLPRCLPDYVDPCPTTVTTLSNGLKIASEDSPGPAACIGLFVDCGSIYESEQFTGVTHLLERMAFKSTKNRSHLRIVREVEATGGNVGASASREQMGYTYDTLKTYVPEALELLVDCIRNPVFLDSEVQDQLAKVKTEIGETSNNPQQFLLESLHPTGFSGALGNPLMAPELVLEKIDGSVIEKFYYVPKSTYVGGDFRYRADSQNTHVALAFEVPGGWHQEKDAVTLTVLQTPMQQTLMGGGGSFSAGGPGKGMHSRLYLRVLNKYQEVQSFSAFSSVYNDTGLFGINLTTGSDFVEQAVEVAADELLAIATPGQVTELELHRAKNATKLAVFMNLESRMIVTEDIGRQILTYGCRKPVQHFLRAIDELTLDDLATLAQKILSSPLTMGSWGDVDQVPSYASVSQHFRAVN